MRQRPGEQTGLALRKALPDGLLMSYVLIPLGVMLLYFAASAQLLPPGVNRVFAARSAGYLLPIVLLLCLILGVAIAFRRVGLAFLRVPGGRPTTSDAVLLLLPLTPVVQYLVNNREILSWPDPVLVCGFFVLLGSLLVLLIPWALQRTGSARPVMYLGLAFAFSLTNMASVAREMAWHEWGSLKIQWPVFGGIWLFGWLLFRLGLRNLMHLLIAVYFSANSLLQLGELGTSRSTADPSRSVHGPAALIGDKRPVITPSIYLLVYDAYVASETMAAYGIDNRSQEQYLQALGFDLYPHTYSLGAHTNSSMGRVLDFTTEYDEEHPRKGVAGDGIVQDLLEGFGYRTYGVFSSDYYFRGTVPGYDFSFPAVSSSAGLLVKAILEGEFRFDVEYEEVSHEQFLEEKRRILSQSSAQPRFVYAHSDLPHHSQNSGACLPNEMELYADRLAQANVEMREDLAMILVHDPQAIVIVAGDHGPYLTKNCTTTSDEYDLSEISRLDLQDRLGAFLAIRWPTAEAEVYDEIIVLQDLFPSVLAYLFADPGLLETRPVPTSADAWLLSGAKVAHGVIVGGIHDGQPLFTSPEGGEDPGL